MLTLRKQSTCHTEEPQQHFVFPTALGLLLLCLDHPATLAAWVDILSSVFSIGRAVYDSCLAYHSHKISETVSLALS